MPIDFILQYQLSNGNWVDCGDRTDEFLSMCLKHNQHVGVNSMDQVISALKEGKELQYFDSLWYANCRKKPEPREIPMPKMVKCSCGHTIPAGQVMNASLGTSCPNCYDRMAY
jgi:hypothetical protein